MSSSQAADNQSNQGTTMNKDVSANKDTEVIIKSESPYVSNLESETIEDITDQFQDSGFFDGADSTASSYHGDKDFILFDAVTRDDGGVGEEDYYFTEEDAVDIASTKANHGSAYNKATTSISSQLYNGPSHDAAYYNEPEDFSYYHIHEAAEPGTDQYVQHPSHKYTATPETQPSFSTLNGWTSTPERHELIACQFQQPPNPYWAYQDSQNLDYDIELP